jgi:hypothetical protein
VSEFNKPSIEASDVACLTTVEQGPLDYNVPSGICQNIELYERKKGILLFPFIDVIKEDQRNNSLQNLDGLRSDGDGLTV